jgi:hypothetical protein
MRNLIIASALLVLTTLAACTAYNSHNDSAYWAGVSNHIKTTEEQRK